MAWDALTARALYGDVIEHRKSVMILEVAVLDVKPGQGCEFETVFGEAQRIIESMPGYVSHQLQKCIEKPDRYLLLVNG